MSAGVLLAVLLGAFLHASWNVLVKAGHDTRVAAAGVYIGAGVLSAIALPFLPAPSAASWPYLAASTVVEVLYGLLLAAAYRLGDLSHAYPLMRGNAPRLSLGRRAPTVARRRTGRGVLGRLVHAGAVGDDARAGGRGCRGSRDLDRVRRGARGDRAARAGHASACARRSRHRVRGVDHPRALRSVASCPPARRRDAEAGGVNDNNIRQAVAQGPLTSFQALAIALCIALNMLDGFDILAK